MNRIALSPDIEATFAAAWNNRDLTMADLKRKFRISDRTIRKLAKDLGLPSRRCPDVSWSDERAAEAARLYREGVQPMEIAVRFGFTRNQVNSKLDRMGVLRRRSETPLSQVRERAAAARAPRAPEVKRAPYVNAGTHFRHAKTTLLTLVGDDAAPCEAKAEPPVRDKAWEPLPGVAPIRFLDAEPTHCRWPIELGDGQYWCCGAIATERPAQPYCKFHARLSQPDQQTRKRVDKRVDTDVRQAFRRAAA